MSETYNPATLRLIMAIERGEIPADIGFLVGLDRPAMLSPDAAALMAARRRDEVLARGHRWRVVTGTLWNDLLDLGRERPQQRAYVVLFAALEEWLGAHGSLEDLEADGWRGNQGTTWVVPILPDDQ